MAPQIGQRATLNGKPVVWSGENYGWQSPSSHTKLKNAGKLKIGTQAIDRLVSSVANSSPIKAIQGFQQSFRKATDNIPGIKQLDRLAVNGSSARLLPSDVPMEGAAILAQKVGEYLNLDPRLVTVGMVAAGGGGRFPKGTATSLGQPRRTTKPQPAVNKTNLPDHQWQTGTRVRIVRNPDGTVKKRVEQEFSQLTPTTRVPDGASREDYLRQMAEDIKPKPGKPAPPLDNRSAPVPVELRGSPSQRPASQAQYNEPSGTRPQRVHVQGTGGTKRLETGYDIKTSDLAKPRGDGNDYGSLASQSDVQGYTNSGQFIEYNGKRYRTARDARRAQWIDEQTGKKVKTLKHDVIREDVLWADDDVSKLNKILTDLGGKPQRYASDAKRAINKRLNAIENIHGGKAAPTKTERANLTDQWDWLNFTGATEAERKRMAALATGKFNHLFKPIIQQLQDTYFKGAQVPPEIQRRLDAMADAVGLRSRQQRTNPKAYTNKKPKRSEKADRRQENDDKKVQASMTKPPYEPKLTDAEREAARRSRAGRPLRPAKDRLKSR
jgi:hypothetical protein